jgi:hypothetical protein
MPNEYNMDFLDAARMALNLKALIVGEQFAKGVFIQEEDGILVVKERRNSQYYKVSNLMLSNGVLNQKYKTIVAASDTELGLN